MDRCGRGSLEKNEGSLQVRPVIERHFLVEPVREKLPGPGLALFHFAVMALSLVERCLSTDALGRCNEDHSRHTIQFELGLPLASIGG
jgi:hypothetical protein